MASCGALSVMRRARQFGPVGAGPPPVLTLTQREVSVAAAQLPTSTHRAMLEGIIVAAKARQVANSLPDVTPRRVIQRRSGCVSQCGGGRAMTGPVEGALTMRAPHLAKRIMPRGSIVSTLTDRSHQTDTPPGCVSAGCFAA